MTSQNYCLADDNPAIASGYHLFRSPGHGFDDSGIRQRRVTMFRREARRRDRGRGHPSGWGGRYLFVREQPANGNLPGGNPQVDAAGQVHEVILDEMQMSESPVTLDFSTTL